MAEEALVGRVGMLWYDDRGNLGERIVRAKEYYEVKYGRAATWARVNKKDVDGVEWPEIGLEIEWDSTVLPFHIWIGSDDEDG